MERYALVRKRIEEGLSRAKLLWPGGHSNVAEVFPRAQSCVEVLHSVFIDTGLPMEAHFVFSAES